MIRYRISAKRINEKPVILALTDYQDIAELLCGIIESEHPELNPRVFDLQPANNILTTEGGEDHGNDC